MGDALSPALASAIAAATRVWAPPPRLTVSEWAERYRHLSLEASAEPGLWRNERAPHLIAPMDALSPYHPARRVVCKFGTQSGKTEVLLNAIGYVMDCTPGPVLCIQPNVTPMGERFSKQRVAPMLRDCPTLSEKAGKARARDSQNTITEKSFPGGMLFIGGANSPAGLASMPIRYLLCDEIGRWEVTKEGDPLALARERLETFYNLGVSKELIVSSPTYADIGISAEYARCSQQLEWHLRCEHCGATQFPKLKHFRWEKGHPETVRYICEQCGAEHPASVADRIKAAGLWVCVKDGPPHSIGYWHNKFASPFARWETVISKWEEAGDDPSLRQVQVNTSFAEDWEGDGEKIEHHTLMSRAEDWGPHVPDGVQYITIGADVQGDRLEAEAVGWGPGWESWSLGYEVFAGDPTGQDVWNDLAEYYRETWTTASGSVIKPSAMCVDSSAYTQHVYEFIKRTRDTRIIPIKGDEGMKRDAIKGTRIERQRRAAKRMRDGKPPEILGVDGIKLTLYHYLNAAIGKTGYCHFPAGREEEYYLQLTGERLMTTQVRGGRPDRRWVKIHAAVEALDCRVYAMGAALLAGLPLAPGAAQSAARAQPAATAPDRPRAVPKPAPARPVSSGRGLGKAGW